jgi:hypothetical protein
MRVDLDVADLKCSDYDIIIQSANYTAVRLGSAADCNKLFQLPMQVLSGANDAARKHAGLAAGRYANLSLAAFRQLRPIRSLSRGRPRHRLARARRHGGLKTISFLDLSFT